MTTTKIIKTEKTPQIGDMLIAVFLVDVLLLLVKGYGEDECVVINIGHNNYSVFGSFKDVNTAMNYYMTGKNEGQYKRFYGTVQLIAEV